MYGFCPPSSAIPQKAAIQADFSKVLAKWHALCITQNNRAKQALLPRQTTETGNSGTRHHKTTRHTARKAKKISRRYNHDVQQEDLHRPRTRSRYSRSRTARIPHKRRSMARDCSHPPQAPKHGAATATAPGAATIAPATAPMKAEVMDTATIAAGTTAGGTATAPGTAREATTVATTTAAGAKATLPTSPPSSARPT